MLRCYLTNLNRKVIFLNKGFTVELAGQLILGLVGFLQIIFIVLVTRIFVNIDSLYKLIALTQKECRDKIDKNEDEAKREREAMKIEYTNILDKHYVTTGQLNTLEEKLIGKIQALSIAIEHLTEAIKLTYKGD